MENKMGAAVIALAPRAGEEDAFQENVNVVVENLARPMPPREYWQGSRDAMSRMLRDFKGGQVRDVTIDQRPWVAADYTHRTEMSRLKVLVFLGVYGRTGYVITCTAALGAYDSYRDQFDTVAHSFRIEQP
jgi:hypothetical protein